MSNQQAITVSSLTVEKQKKPVLNDVNFSLESGKIIGLIGPSGSGKTTLMRTLIGMQIPTKGSASLLGKPAGAAQLRSSVGYVSQSPAVYSDLTVEQNLRYFASLVRANKDQITEILEQVDLTPQRRQMVATLSGGQIARVSLAIALLGAPSILVFDEPTVGLDPVLRNQLWDLFRKLSGQDKTIIVSSHVMDEAERCDELLLLRDGKLLWQGSSQALLKKTATDSVEDAFLKLVKGGEA